METPAHLPSRPREFINLISDDEDGGDASPGPRPHAGHYPGIDDLNGLAFGNMLHENQVAWGAVQFEAQGVPTPIFQGWENEAPQPVPEVVVPPAGAQRLHDNQAMWKAARSEAQRVPVPMFQEWANEMPRPVPGLIVPPAAAKGLPQMFRQAERLNTNPLPVDQVHKMADNDRLNNENRLIQEVVDNPMGNYQPDNESDLILAELNSQFRNKRVDNEDMDNGNFAWEQVNRDQHNQNKPINLDSPPNEMDNKARCLEGVTEIFPDICREYIGQLYSELDGRKTVTALAELVLEKEENGKPYPKINQLKRKRPVETDDEEETMRKYMTDQRHNSEGYQSMARSILSEEFSSIPMNFIMKHINDSGVVIYTAYQNLAEAERLRDPSNPSYNKLKQARRAKLYLPHSVEEKLADPELPSEQRHALSELKDARRGRAKWQVKMAAKKQLDADETAAKLKYEADEAANLELAMKGGTMEDCGCCYDDFPRNRMVCCNNETKWHYFCKRCTRLHAETQVGNGKYELQCMSTDVCEASYSYEQRQIFLDAKLTTALDRIEAETVLRLAGIENLASCPFCPYAAEYPPVEVERLFKCELESCAKVSCRLCWKESHVPKTCKEHAKDIGLDVRREVEEAMTSAMVRLCNKCKSPFIKEEGCNKMMCPCGNIQCYVCSKSCEYDHFDDTRRGGKSGNCPLFDDVNKRHEDETKSAEKAIVEKLQKEHPGMAREDLEIKVSDAVKEDEEKRKKMRWNYNERRFYMDGAGELQRLPGDPRPLLARDRVAEREAIRARFRELGPRQNNPDLFNWEEYFNQNPQG
ncbi:hypothetical protein V492_01267 [Pseudogymnoascus sp. VKM F-4246]|nr:hypothetical protein V492_01267 [Pseudogymnoascus sp. VKM F-4246]